MAKIKRYHPGPWECVHERASEMMAFEWPSKHPMALWFHKPIPWGGKTVTELTNVTISRSSRKWIAITLDKERLWLRKREVRCIRFDHPPKQSGANVMEDILARAGGGKRRANRI